MAYTNNDLAGVAAGGLDVYSVLRSNVAAAQHAVAALVVDGEHGLYDINLLTVRTRASKSGRWWSTSQCHSTSLEAIRRGPTAVQRASHGLANGLARSAREAPALAITAP